MTFRPAVQGETTSAYYMNGNFEDIAMNNRIPREGVDLDFSDNKYNLGTRYARWLNTYVVELNVTSFITKCWNNLVDVTLSATSSYTSFEGLNGDDYQDIMILLRLKSKDSTRSEVFLKVNSSTTDSYHHLYVSGKGFVVSRDHNTESSTSICYAAPGTSRPTNTSGFSIIHMNTARGHYRNGIIYRIDGSTNTTLDSAYSMTLKTFSYLSKDDTITSIQIFTDTGYEMASQTSIQIWGLP